jgi:hypothetical protein
MATVSLRISYVTEKPSAQINQMKVLIDVVSRTFGTITTNVAVVRKINGSVPTLSASKTPSSVMGNPNAWINLTRTKNSAALKASMPTPPKSAAVTQLQSSHVNQVTNVFPTPSSAMAKPNVTTNLTRAPTSAVSKDSLRTTPRTVAVPRPNGPVPPVTSASVSDNIAMDQLTAEMDQTKELRKVSAATKDLIFMMRKYVAVILALNGPA